MLDHLIGFYDYHSEMVISIAYKFFLACIVFVISNTAARVVNRAIDRANDRFDKIDATLVPMLKTTFSIVIYVVAGVVMLDIFGVNTTSIITLLGAAGLAVGLALKDTLGNIAAGIILLILRPFKVGHYIECGTVAGTVKAVTLFATNIETGDGINISAPNSTLWGSPIKNFTVNGKRRMDITIGISYSDSIDGAFAVLSNIVKNEKRFLTEPAAQIILLSMATSAVNIQLRAWTTVDDYWDTYWDINKAVKEQIEAAGLSIPFPQMDVHIKKESP